jgi:hypothetical protein
MSTAKKKPAKLLALHATSEGGDHLVAVKKLHVLLSKDGPGWFAQGLEIDYAACGASVEETKKNFETGFCKTIYEHLVVHGDIERFLKVASQEAWAEYYACPNDATKQVYSSFQFHKKAACDSAAMPDIEFPFAGISFVSKEQLPLAAAA